MRLPGVEAEKKAQAGPFFPQEPEDAQGLNVSDAIIEQLALKTLFSRGSETGRGLARELCVSMRIVAKVINDLRKEQLITQKGVAELNDFNYQVTDAGRVRAREYFSASSYQGACPVALEDYIESVTAQTITVEQPGPDDLERAFGDLLIDIGMLDRLGPAINSGRGMFLYGFPGNGKTSIAERITKCFGTTIYIPKTLFIDGQFIGLFDPETHEEIKPDPKDKLLKKDSTADEGRLDRRWVQIQRPTVVAGGELTMPMLEIAHNPETNISEAPLQLKSNCGTLVIDDFGRQRMNPDELLNRWIVPLEKRFDFLTLSTGKKIQVPFDQLIIFSTNLEPRDLVDEAFLRRIPYKIMIVDPTEENFRKLFQILAPTMGFEYDNDVVTYIIDTHFKAEDRPMRACHPRDLLLQVLNYCNYQGFDPEMLEEYFDQAVENYFTVM
jgi:predicted ATPase with chaperone activity